MLFLLLQLAFAAPTSRDAGQAPASGGAVGGEAMALPDEARRPDDPVGLAETAPPPPSARWDVAHHLPFPVWQTQLDNGLTVWVNPRPGHGSVATSVIVRAGARYEPEGKSGLAHLVEHMVFTGTASRSEADVVRFVRDRGGYRNGHTMPERVYFYTHLQPEHTEEAIAWLGDVVFRPTLDAAKLDKERRVVFEEMGGAEIPIVARVRDRIATRRLIDAMRQVYFPDSTLHHDPMGHPADLLSLDIDDVRAYHQERFVAANAALIVVGEIEADAVLAMADAHLGSLPAVARSPTPPPPALPPALGPVRTVSAPKLTDSCTYVLGTRVMGRDDPDIWGMDLLAEYLMDRLWDDLRIREGLVYKLLSRNWFHANIGMFQLETEGSCAHQEAIHQAMSAAVDEVIRGDVDDARLAIVQRMYVGQWHMRMEPNLGRIEWLTRWVLPDGDPLSYADGPPRVAAVTAADLERLAGAWLAPEQRTLWVHRPLVGRSWVAGAVMVSALLALILIGRTIRRQR